MNQRYRLYQYIVRRQAVCLEIATANVFHEIVDIQYDFLFDVKQEIVDVNVVYDNVFQVRRNVMTS